VPSLQLHYRAFITPTHDSAPALRFGTLTLVGLPLESLPSHRNTGSHVPHKSLNQGHAALMPDAIWVVNRYPPDFIPRLTTTPWLLTSLLRFRQFVSGLLSFVSLILT
jgi:hypothetical protein